jgi:geranylgeranyl diphosphate synthase, type I
MGMEYFTARAAELRPFLDSRLKRAGEEFAFLRPWGRDVPDRLSAFARGGKLIRGGLAFLGQELGGGLPDEKTLNAAAAMELLQSAFLVHDDIMDRDRLRRGMPAVFWQYREAAAARGLEDSYHYGESMGICAGDCSFFMAFSLLSAAGMPPAILSYCVREVYAVGLAQMQDVDFGAFPDIPAEEDILTLYTWKTGRYSFSLPLAVGAMLAGAGAELISRLEKLGESLGIAFQMRDDELGIFGMEASLGKPIGSDIREGKKTFLITLAASRMNEAGRARLSSILGKADATEAEMAEFRRLIEASGAREELASRMAGLSRESTRLIGELDAPAGAKDLLSALLDFISSRSS